MSRRILVVGKAGQVGRELLRTLAPLGQVIAVGRDQLDLADSASISACLRAIGPRVIINAAAYTAVDRAESESDIAYAVNAKAPETMAAEAKQLDALFVHYSTDYVFDGQSERAYVETDRCAPLNVYGASKWAGEQAVGAVGGAHLIFRTSWVYGAHGNNFLKTMLRLAPERDEFKIVDDQRGAPTWSRLIAEQTAQVLTDCFARGGLEAAAKHSGTYHLSASGVTSWRQFAEAIFEIARLKKRPAVRPIASAEYPTPAKRPLNSTLDNAKLISTFGLVQTPWNDALQMCIEDMCLAEDHASVFLRLANR